MSASPWYRDTTDVSGIPPAVAERALEWLVELQGDAVPAAVREEWARWRDAHPDHARAWQRIEAVGGRLQPLASPMHAAVAQATLLGPRSAYRRRIIKALTVIVFAGGAGWGLEARAPWRVWSADYRTAVGERRELVLADGTKLVLNTDSAIDVRFDAAERRIRLLAGEIFIATAVDRAVAPRPFLVETTEGTAQALGTEYTVRQQDGDTRIGVYKGAVRVRPRGDAGRALDIQAGYAAIYTAGAIEPPRQEDEDSAAWKDGFIVAHGMRLDDFIAELARYSPESLSCDPGIAGLRVSGSFPLRDIDQVMRTVGTTLGAQLEIRRRFWGKAMRLVPGPGAAQS
ncbi:histidine kinase [Bordetella genomosp. 9]|uniref:Histidine kinase n=1 Tax=Bordetella genomosp. 9 TaxID=1416803 RepID=A0A261RMX5_9BORD|nr:FecR family protein [Bordetella genomosp. 9]OZI26408.1 histidine kinase [Bordetella genomosp. 9]